MTGHPKLVVASGNPGKLREIAEILGEILKSHPIELVRDATLSMSTVEETGATFVENALLKARHAARATGYAALGDDSGLEVDALGGAPGIRSARYAGEGASDAHNTAKLLAALQERADRRARFRCVMVVLRHVADPAPLICQGTWEGRITDVPRGDGGFGYDPVFVPSGLDRTVAELEQAHKNRVSHRGQALTELALLLGRFLAP